jgi:hypothetical protein
VLDIKGRAELKSLSLRKEFHGDELKKAVTIGMLIEGVALEAIEGGIIANLGLIYDEDEPMLQNLKPFDVISSVRNVEIEIGSEGRSVKLSSADISDLKVAPLSGRVGDVAFKIKAQADGAFADFLHDRLLESVDVAIIQRQLELAPEPK